MSRMRVNLVAMGIALALITVSLFAWQAGAASTNLRIAFPLVLGSEPEIAPRYVVVAWNDLGMHCYNPSFEDLSILPPYNTLYAQVVALGNPPRVITRGVELSYDFPDNTYSVGKTDFWTYAQQLFGADLPDNIGLAGKGLAGIMDARADHFVATGIPLTEFRDSAPTVSYPYQLARIIVRDTATRQILAQTSPVAPVSTEMQCGSCHFDGGVEDIATGRVETNILTLHDYENQDEYPSGKRGALMNRRPINCAECHRDNALDAPGVAGVPSLSHAMHDRHEEEVPSTMTGCYLCHPGPQTQCLRDVMSQQGMTCADCHGGMDQVASNPNPWLQEPRCDSAVCHGSSYALDEPLYRNALGHGGLYCAACHDSPHAIAPSREANDAIKFQQIQGDAGPLRTCSVCHTQTPSHSGPHGLSAP